MRSNLIHLAATLAVASTLSFGTRTLASEPSSDVLERVRSQAKLLEQSLKIPSRLRSPNPGEEVSSDAVQKLQERAKEQEKTMKVEPVVPKLKSQELPKTEALMKAYKEELARQQRQRLGGDKPNPFLGEQFSRMPTTQPQAVPPATEGEQIYVLVSASVPQETIRAYLYSLKKLGSPRVHVAIRGLIDGDMTATYRWARRMIQEDPECLGSDCKQIAQLEINPVPFRQLKIDKVPALAWINGDQSAVLYGDASLGYALERFTTKGWGTLPANLAAKLGSDSESSHDR